MTEDTNRYRKKGMKIIRKITRLSIPLREKFILSYVKQERDNGLTSFFLAEFLYKLKESLEPSDIEFVVANLTLFLNETYEKFGNLAEVFEVDALSRNYADAHYYLAKIGGTEDEVEEHLRRSTECMHPAALIDYAYFLDSQKRFEEALPIWKNALEWNEPKESGIILNRIGCIIAMEDPLKAFEYFTKAAEFGDEASIDNLQMYDAWGNLLQSHSGSEEQAAESLAMELPIPPGKRRIEENNSSQELKRQKEATEEERPLLSLDELLELSDTFYEEILRVTSSARDKLLTDIAGKVLRGIKKRIYEVAALGLNYRTISSCEPRFQWTPSELKFIQEIITSDPSLQKFTIETRVDNKTMLFDVTWKDNNDGQ